MRKPRTLEEDSPADRALHFAVGKRIRELRQERNMTQKELADLSDVKSTYITLIEATGVNLSLTLLLQLATALGVAPQDLFSSSDQGGTSDQTIPLVRTKVVRLKKEIKRLEEEITSLEEILEGAPPAGTQLTARPTGRTEH